MKRIFKIIGIVIAIAILILFIIVGFANGKRFLSKTGYKDCPVYISITAEFTKIKIDTSIIREKINDLKIGDVVVKSVGENQVEIILSNDIKSAIPLESQRQILIETLHELDLQETREIGVGDVYRAKTCFGEE